MKGLEVEVEVEDEAADIADAVDSAELVLSVLD